MAWVSVQCPLQVGRSVPRIPAFPRRCLGIQWLGWSRGLSVFLYPARVGDASLVCVPVADAVG